MRNTDENGSLPLNICDMTVTKLSANLFGKEQQKIEVFTVSHN